jgi:hypothetical protein
MVIAPSSRTDPALPLAVTAHPAAEHVGLRDGTAVWLHSLEPESVRDERAEIAARDGDGRTVGRAGYRRVYGPRAVLTLEADDPLWAAGLPAVLLASAGRCADAGGITTFLIGVSSFDGRLLLLLSGGVLRPSPSRTAYLDIELPVSRSLAADVAPRHR